MNNINNVTLIGRVKEPFVEKRMGKRGLLMVTKISTTRLSGVQDEVVIAVPSDMLEEGDYVGEKIFLEGKFVSHNEPDQAVKGRRSRLVLYALAEVFYVTDDWVDDKNELELEGFLCKAPGFREKESGYRIADLLIANNEENGAANYIPCICWGDQAVRMKDISVSSEIHFQARVQSRNFLLTRDGKTEVSTVYECSIWRILSSVEPKKKDILQEA